MLSVLFGVLIFLAVVLILTPIIWMFLKLAGKVGPESKEDAGALGIVLFCVCWFCAGGLLVLLLSLLHLSF